MPFEKVFKDHHEIKTGFVTMVLKFAASSQCLFANTVRSHVRQCTPKNWSGYWYIHVCSAADQKNLQSLSILITTRQI